MNNSLQPAGFGLRLLASLIDSVILMLPLLLLLTFAAQSETLQAALPWVFATLLYIFASPAIFYTILTTHYVNGTPGKLLVGMIVTDEEGNHLRLTRNIFRHTIGYVFASMLFCIGYVNIITDPNKQGWHDKAAGSKVLITTNRWPLGLLSLLVLLGACGMLLYSMTNSLLTGPMQKELATLFASAKQSSKEGKYYPENYVSKEYSEKLDKIWDLQDAQKDSEAETQARALLQTAETNEEKASAARLLAESLFNQQKLEEALPYAEQAIVLYPDYAVAYQVAARIESQLGNHEKAIEYAQKAITFPVEQANANYVYGIVLFEAGQEDQGMVYLEKAVTLAPKNQDYQQTFTEAKKLFITPPTGTPLPTKPAVVSPTTTPTPKKQFSFEKQSPTISFPMNNGYGLSVVLLDENGQIVTNQEGFSYQWSSDNPAVGEIKPWSVCTRGIQAPCPEDHAAIAPKMPGTTTIKASVSKNGAVLDTMQWSVTITEKETY